MIRIMCRAFAISSLIIGQAAFGESDTSLWRLSFNTNWLGPMEAHVELTLDGTQLTGASKSGAISLLQALPGDQDLTDGLVAFNADSNEGKTYNGSFRAPWKEGKLSIVIDGDTLSGTVEGGAFDGDFSGKRVVDSERIRDYPKILERLDAVVAAKVFAPEKLQESSYLEFRAQLGEIAAVAQDDLDMLFGFHWLWKNDPFSHFQLKRSARPAEEMFSFFDSYRVGFDAATVEIDGDIAILKVATMMGADTIEQIEAAYDEIAASEAKYLVIDLRGNGGGAFAVKPLAAHLISEPLDSGYFLSQLWGKEHDDLPTIEQVMATPAWDGWSIIDFWRSVQEQELLRIRFQPSAPRFTGKVFVLLDKQSASATELAADALRASGVATLIGETTAGEMLSQSFFDVAEGFTISLPVADYYSLAHGRIEGVGVPVDIESADAMATAKALAAE
ncbi:MAG: S41 family peptidase [Gammaproteobacteria bacterium]|nr:S41 family peptidase [Gammaproteobacteria bacterium]